MEGVKTYTRHLLLWCRDLSHFIPDSHAGGTKGNHFLFFFFLGPVKLTFFCFSEDSEEYISEEFGSPCVKADVDVKIDLKFKRGDQVTAIQTK